MPLSLLDPDHQTYLLLDKIEYPRFARKVSLRNFCAGYYRLVFEFVQQAWDEHDKILSDISMDTSGVKFMGHVDSYSVVWIAKTRYGAASTH